jgi:DNA-binding IclR family transcriptional regulator
MDKTGRVQAIDRAVQILQCFSEKRPELKLAQISDELGLNKSTVHGIISTLKFHGLIEQDEETQKYRLGVYLMHLGDLVSRSIDVVGIARPYITDICNVVEETVHLATLDDLEVVYIDKIESTQSMRIFSARGARNPAYCTGVGKAMLAYLDPNVLTKLLENKVLESLTPKTITDKNELVKELATIRERGFSFDDEENNIGLTCVAAPVFDHMGRAKYGISISGPTARMNEGKIQESIHIITTTAKEISSKLGYKG